jgi:hypothetical protein
MPKTNTLRTLQPHQQLRAAVLHTVWSIISQMIRAVEPAVGDLPVRGLGHVDAVPAHVRRRVGAHARALLAALLLQVEVVAALPCSAVLKPASSIPHGVVDSEIPGKRWVF